MSTCPECHGKRTIELFCSIVPCSACATEPDLLTTSKSLQLCSGSEVTLTEQVNPITVTVSANPYFTFHSTGNGGTSGVLSASGGGGAGGSLTLSTGVWLYGLDGSLSGGSTNMESVYAERLKRVADLLGCTDGDVVGAARRAVALVKDNKCLRAALQDIDKWCAQGLMGVSKERTATLRGHVQLALRQGTSDAAEPPKDEPQSWADGFPKDPEPIPAPPKCQPDVRVAVECMRASREHRLDMPTDDLLEWAVATTRREEWWEDKELFVAQNGCVLRVGLQDVAELLGEVEQAGHEVAFFLTSCKVFASVRMFEERSSLVWKEGRPYAWGIEIRKDRRIAAGLFLAVTKSRKLGLTSITGGFVEA